MNAKETYDIWKKQKLPKYLKQELNKMTKKEIEMAFNKDLKFGTAGIRGIVGAGTGKINEIIIMKTTVAFIQYLKSYFSEKELLQGVIIVHDNRHFSAEFSILTAKTLAKYKIPVFLFKKNKLTPTPLLSYSIKKINAIAGIAITASHNPPEYNGYKIYNQYGCQILPNITNIIYQNMKKIKDNFQLKFNYDKNLIKEIPLTIKFDYFNDIKNLQFYKKNKKRNFKIIFSNLHGTSREWVKPILEKCGYTIILVKEQSKYDPNFKNVISPNPEIKETFNLAIKYAKKHDAPLIILNDPDADRIGIAIKHNNIYIPLNGNEIGIILLEYLLSHYKKNKLIPKNPVIYNTFVTSDLSDIIAKSYGCQVIKTLTGFKWISAEMLKEKIKNINFIFGFEEAYGYVIKNNITYDKDGIQSAMIAAEAAWYYQKSQKTLIDVLENIYKKFGYYYCHNLNIKIENKKEINIILKKLRKEKIKELKNVEIAKIEDFKNCLYEMPSQNLIKIFLKDGSWFAVRPSGTEPIIKFYFVCIDKNNINAKLKMKKIYEQIIIKYLNIKNIKL